MSSQQSPSASARPSLPKTYFSNMVHLLRRANSRYAEAAANFRHAYQPTHHARKRAQKLKLSVSIDAAKRIDPRQVSVIPLPVLATPLPIAEPSMPVYQTPASRRAQRPVLEPLAIPGMAVVGREREIKRQAEAAASRRPVLRCDIPQEAVPHPGETLSSCVSVSLSTAASDIVGPRPTEMLTSAALMAMAQAPRVLRGQNVPWRPVTSRWSMTESELSVSVDTNSIQIDEASSIAYSSDFDESMTDLETSSPEVAERRPAPASLAVEAGRVLFVAGAARQVKEATPSVRSRKNPGLRLDAPIDISERYSWSSDIPYSAIMEAGTSASSSSSSSAGGPITPDSSVSASASAAADCPYSLPLLDFQVGKAQVEQVQPKPRVSSVKRKCSESFIDFGYGEGEARPRAGSPEKRAKYQRKHWTRLAGEKRTSSSSGSADGQSFWQ